MTQLLQTPIDDIGLLRIVILTPQPSLSVKSVFRQHQLVGLSSYSDQPATGDVAPSFKAFVRRGLDRLRGRQTLHSWATSEKIPFHFYSRSQPEVFADWLGTLQPDLLITCQAPLLPESVFRVPRMGSINIHYSRLPEYRGGSPLLWQVVNGELKGGLTIHFIDTGIDTGPIIKQAVVELPQGASESQLLGLFEVLTRDSLLPALKRLAVEEIPVFEQPPKRSTSYARNISEPSLLEFIDWVNWPIDKIWRTLRYMDYWPQEDKMLQGWRKFLRWKVGQVACSQRQPALNDFKLECRGLRALILFPSGSIQLEPKFHFSTLVRAVLRGL